RRQRPRRPSREQGRCLRQIGTVGRPRRGRDASARRSGAPTYRHRHPRHHRHAQGGQEREEPPTHGGDPRAQARRAHRSADSGTHPADRRALCPSDEDPQRGCNARAAVQQEQARRRRRKSPRAIDQDSEDAPVQDQQRRRGELTMAKLPPAQQWAIQKMNEYEVAEEIEKFIDFVDKDGRSVALPMKFVKAWMKRDDGVLPILAAIATLPIVLADGHVLAMEEGDFDEERGIEFHIPKEVMALMPRREDCTPEAVADAMQYLTD